MPQVKKRGRRRRHALHFSRIDEDFMSQPKNFHVLDRLISYTESKNIADGDLQRSDVVKNLLKYAFSLQHRTPGQESVQSVKSLFLRTRFADFKKYLYRYSACVAMHLWVDKVQKTEPDPSTKLSILSGNSYAGMPKLCCELKGVEFNKRKSLNLGNDRGSTIFRNSLKCSDENFLKIKSFVEDNFPREMSDELKNDVGKHAKRFFMDRLNNRKMSSYDPQNSPVVRIEKLLTENFFEMRAHNSRDVEDRRDVQGQTVVTSSAEAAPRQTGSQVHLPTGEPISSVRDRLDEILGLKEGLKRKACTESSCSSSQPAAHAASKRKKTEIEPVPPSVSPEAAPILIDLSDDPEDVEMNRNCVKVEVVDVDDDLDLEIVEAPSTSNTESHRHSIAVSLETQWRNQDPMCDVLFVAEGGVTDDEKCMRAHRCIVSAGSPKLAELLRNIARERKDLTVNMDNMSFEALHKMLGFMYTGKIDEIDVKTADDLLASAEEFQISNLKSSIEKLLIKDINISNGLVVFELAKAYKLKSLKDIAEQFVLRHLERCEVVINFKN